jgi:ATP adenylyltransferase
LNRSNDPSTTSIRMSDRHDLAPEDDLLALARTRLAAAAESGALRPIATETHWLNRHGCHLPVRLLKRFRTKIAAGQAQRAEAEAGRPANPFLPYEPAMYVCHLPPRHVVLLNKFPVLDEHLLIVTDDYHSQDELLDADDFTALLTGLARVDGLGFFNGGKAAGASQHHKHLQLLPLASFGGELPLAPLLAQAEFTDDGIGRSAALPFAHAIARIEPSWLADPISGSAAMAVRYRELFAALDIKLDGQTAPLPYNLLATREQFWLVPRRRENAGEFYLNALGYAGAMLVLEEAQIERLAAADPLQLLAEAGLPPSN